MFREVIPTIPKDYICNLSGDSAGILFEYFSVNSFEIVSRNSLNDSFRSSFKDSFGRCCRRLYPWVLSHIPPEIGSFLNIILRCFLEFPRNTLSLGILHWIFPGNQLPGFFQEFFQYFQFRS